MAALYTMLTMHRYEFSSVMQGGDGQSERLQAVVCHGTGIHYNESRRIPVRLASWRISKEPELV